MIRQPLGKALSRCRLAVVDVNADEESAGLSTPRSLSKGTRGSCSGSSGVCAPARRLLILASLTSSRATFPSLSTAPPQESRSAR